MKEPQSFSLRGSLRCAAVILSWYCISAVVILTSKWVLSEPLARNGPVLFPFPLIITTCSNTITTVWAFLFSRHRNLRPPALTFSKLKHYVVPIGLVTAFDIGCSNVALRLLTVSFGTIIKSSGPVFTMLWGLVFGIEYFSGRVFLALFTISAGVGLATFGEGAEFVLKGFLLQLTATSLAGLRWALTQVLIDGHGEPMPPLAVVLYTSPATAIFVLPFAVLLEGGPALAHLSTLPRNDMLLLGVLVLAIGTLVFILLCSEYFLVDETSSLTLSVTAVFKELLTIGGGIVLFSEHVSLLNIVGFFTCQIGIAAYVYLRYTTQKPNNSEKEEVDELGIPLTQASEDPWDDRLFSPIPQVSRVREF